MTCVCLDVPVPETPKRLETPLCQRKSVYRLDSRRLLCTKYFSVNKKPAITIYI